MTIPLQPPRTMKNAQSASVFLLSRKSGLTRVLRQKWSRILSVPARRRIMLIEEQPDRVTLEWSNAFEHVGQMSASVRFSFGKSERYLGPSHQRKPAYEKGRKWKRHTQ